MYSKEKTQQYKWHCWTRISQYVHVSMNDWCLVDCRFKTACSAVRRGYCLSSDQAPTIGLGTRLQLYRTRTLGLVTAESACKAHYPLLKLSACKAHYPMPSVPEKYYVMPQEET